MFIFPRDEKNEPNTGANGAISNIEGWKSHFAPAALLEVEIDEINDLMARRQQAVGKIPGNTAKNQSKCNLTGQRMRVEMMPCEKQGDKRQQRDKRESAVVAAKKTPCRAGVAPVNKFKKSVHDDFFTTFRERIKHNPFGELIKHKHNQRKRCDTPV